MSEPEAQGQPETRGEPEIESEPETGGPPHGDWAPPTGAPAPRPDPYAQFGNPLHDTWGTSQQQSPTAPAPARVSKVRKKRPGRRWAIVAAVLVLLLVGGWLARDTLLDVWDRLYDRASDLSDGDDAGDPPPEGSDTTVSTTRSVDDRFAEIEAANRAAFGDWMDANREELSAAVGRMEVAGNEMVVLDQATGASAVDFEAGRATLVESRDATLEAVLIMDGAPESAIRDAFVTVLLLQVDETNQMIAASDAQDEEALRAASSRFARVRGEATRLCRQYGDRADALCP